MRYISQNPFNIFKWSKLFKGEPNKNQFKLIKDYLCSLETFDYESALKCLSDECQMQIGSNSAISGKEAIMVYMWHLENTIECMEFEFSETIENSSTKVYQGHTYYTFKNGNSCRVPTCHIIKLKRNKINWHYIYRDSLKGLFLDKNMNEI